MSENAARQVWAMVYQHARLGEILCGHHAYRKEQIHAALIGCVLAGVLTLDEVINATSNGKAGEDIPALRIGDKVFIAYPQPWQGSPDETCQKFGSYYDK